MITKHKLTPYELAEAVFDYLTKKGVHPLPVSHPGLGAALTEKEHPHDAHWQWLCYEFETKEEKPTP